MSTPLPLCAAFAVAQVIPSPSGYAPEVLADDGSALQQLARIGVAGGMKVELFAAEPHCANLVALDVAPDGSVYVVETFRRDKQVLDMREWPDWLEDDLACRTVGDRVAMIRKHAKDPALFRKESERIRLLRDRDRDGRVDWSSVFADGFDAEEDGVAAGVLVRGPDVYFTDMPHLWRLTDRDGDGRAEAREALSSGYGVHFNFVGHDLHGLRFGPDGRLYFSLGDRGLDVVTKEGRHLMLPDTGAVLRCEPDGSALELYHTGLRNPQELAFDERGDLFTCDNNSDSGDRARLVQIVKGGETGWSVGWQWISSPNARGPWNSEKMWHPRNGEQPAWILPCVANLVSGPSGLTRDPGGLLPGEFEGAFLICDFSGNAASTRVVAFDVEPDGAGHRLAWQKALVERGILATDVEFGADGCLYVSDWVEGWDQPKRGRVWRVYDPTVRGGAAAREVQRLLTQGIAGRDTRELQSLLGHADGRIRQEAQFALAARGRVDPLRALVRLPGTTRTRVHAAWALAQIARSGGTTSQEAVAALLPLLADRDGELRAQAAKGLGEAHAQEAFAPLVALLRDPQPRARFFAAQALGELADGRAFEPLLELAAANDDGDLLIRHAVVVALAACVDAERLAPLAGHASKAVRMAALLALRRLHAPELEWFLDDREPTLFVEAVRALHDLPIEGAYPRLAALLAQRHDAPLPVLRRAVNAAWRLGGKQWADALARVAAGPSDGVLDGTQVAEIRVEALRALGEFDRPPARDRMLGVYRPCAPRGEPVAVEAVVAVLPKLLESGVAGLAEEAARFAARERRFEQRGALLSLARRREASGGARVAALEALATLQAPELQEVVELLLGDRDPAVRGAARKQLAKLDPQQALVVLLKSLERGTLAEQQEAYAILGEMADPRAKELLAQELDRLAAGEVAAEAALDLLEAARRHPDEPLLAARLRARAALLPADDRVAALAECASGGDPRKGRELFFRRDDLQCMKCHKIGSEGAGEAGPDLAGIGSRRAASYLLASIVDPNRDSAPGYNSTVFVMSDGQLVDGRVIGEDATHWRVATIDRGDLAVLKSGVQSRKSGLSAMPSDVADRLSPRELRDLVAFLASLQ
ncbi:MAG: HEAT repeat domain-containing protein [Planctomycetes bacterium]|nr:HEAT repeat domain-containing protein [Planctomycetota bacterium]